MEIGSMLNMASALQAQRLEQAKLEHTLSTVKEFQDLQASMVAQLLASIPSVNPDGVGGAIDITA
jgi:hypothetical protein